MKLHKLLSTAALLLSTVGLASANQDQYLSGTNYLYVTGSTAYRAPSDAAIIAQFDTSPAAVVYGSDGTIGGEHSAMFSGTIGGQPWVIKACWTGSEAGIQTVAHGNSVGFPPDAFIPSLTTGGFTGLRNATGDTAQIGNGSEADGVTTDNDFHTADYEMSDTQQAASEFQGTFKGQTYAALTEFGSTGGAGSAGTPVGINVFKFWTNKGAPAGLTGVTSQLVRELYAAGELPLSFFTGSTSDEGSTVYAIGRNPDSGTRVTALLESGTGNALTSVKQYAPSTDGSTALQSKATGVTGPIITLIKYPSGSVNGISLQSGNNGYSSGGNLAKVLTSDFTNGGSGITSSASSNTYNATGSGHTASMVGYASSNDGDGQVANGLVELSYNGVKLGVLSDYNTSQPLIEGQYTYWSYEHLYYASPAAAQLTLINAIGTSIPTAPALGSFAPAVRVSSLKAARNIDGGVVGIANGVTVF